jgi:hypothetical protein
VRLDLRLDVDGLERADELRDEARAELGDIAREERNAMHVSRFTKLEVSTGDSSQPRVSPWP